MLRGNVRNMFFILLVCLEWSYSYVIAGSDPLYKNPDAYIEKRVDDLIQRMTIDEKIGQLNCELSYKEGTGLNLLLGHARSKYGIAGQKAEHLKRRVEATNATQKRFIEESRLGIPVIYHEEALHGLVTVRDSTAFPQSIALAAMFNAELMSKVADAIAEEAKVMGVHQVLSPVVNIARDPRWGRTQETYGEDPYLSAVLGAEYVKAFEKNKIIATPKHFVANYGDGGRDSNAPYPSERLLREVYFPPFKACIDAGANSIMPAYNSLNGVPCHTNAWLLKDILRKQWGFKGFVFSDYNAVLGVYSRHKTAETSNHGILNSLGNGTDIDAPFGGKKLKEMYTSGMLKEEVIDQALRNILRVKFEIGLFENPYGFPDKVEQILNCERHKEIALESARQSVVLLKNENDTLPLDRKKINKIALFGPVANQISLGGYSRGTNRSLDISPYEGLKAVAGDNVEILLQRNNQDPIELAKQAEIAIVCVTINEAEGQDRAFLDLPELGEKRKEKEDAGGYIHDKWKRDLAFGSQEALINKVASAGKPTIVVLINGSAITMNNWMNNVQAILEPWYGGQTAGTAIAQVLFGDYNPAGRLPITFPKTVGQVPLYYNYTPSGRKYDYYDIDAKPLFEFGYGLSYTKFKYSDLKMPESISLKELSREPVKISLDVTNTGSRSGDEVVQLYIRDDYACVTQPVKALKDFKRVHLNPGQTKTVTLILTEEKLSLFDREMKFRVEPGTFSIMVGASSEDVRLNGKLNVTD